MAIRQVVLDFDGTCTRVEAVEQAFLAAYRELVGLEWSKQAAARWDEHEQLVRAASPAAGWMLGGVPAAPAAADPYILSGEVVALLVRRGAVDAPLPAERAGSWYKRAYLAHEAPWRDEIREVLATLVGDGRRVAFVSNSAPEAVRARVDALGLAPAVREQIRVHGNAAKFRVQELRFDAPPPPLLAARFGALPAAARASLPRPVYLRRGAYFEALCEVWTEAGTAPEETLVAGDVWELDLAMPAALGAQVHLVRRPEPYPTYPYELAAAAALGTVATVSDDLTGLVARVRAG